MPQKPFFASNLKKYHGCTQPVGDLIQDLGLVVLLDGGFVEVSGVKAYVEGSIWLLGVCQGGHPFHRLCDRGDNFLISHIL